MASLLNLLAMQGNPMAGLLASKSAEESPALLTARQRGVPSGLLGGMNGPSSSMGPAGPPGPPMGPPSPPMGPSAPPGGGPAAGPGNDPSAGIGGALTRIIGGAPDSRLTPEQNEALKKEAYITAGLAMMADEDGGVSAIAKGLLMGRTASATARQEVAEANEARLERLKAQEQEQKRAQILSGINPLDPNARMSVVGDLLGMGDLDAAEQFLKLDKEMAGRSFEEQARVVRRDIVESIDLSSPESMLEASARFTAAGMSGDAQEIRLQADSLQAIAEYRGGLEWKNLGGKQIAIDRDGNVVMEFDNTMSPAERAAYALQVQQYAKAESEGASKDYLKNMTDIQESFLRESGSARVISEFYNMAHAATENPFGDQTLIAAINKITDPMGVIRDSDVQRVMSAGGLTDRLLGIVDKTVDGRIPPNQRAQIIQEIQALAQAARESFESQVLPLYIRRAEVAEVNPEEVLFNPFGGSIYSPLSGYRPR